MTNNREKTASTIVFGRNRLIIHQIYKHKLSVVTVNPQGIEARTYRCVFPRVCGWFLRKCHHQ